MVDTVSYSNNRTPAVHIAFCNIGAFTTMNPNAKPFTLKASASEWKPGGGFMSSFVPPPSIPTTTDNHSLPPAPPVEPESIPGEVIGIENLNIKEDIVEKFPEAGNEIDSVYFI